MKNIIIFALLILIIFPSVLAINIQVETQSSDEVIIQEINKPAIFNLEITNMGGSDSFAFYNIQSFRMTPMGTIPIANKETKNVEVTFFPIQDNFETTSPYQIIEYYIKATDGTQEKQQLTIKVLKLKDVFEINSDKIIPGANEINVSIRNKEDIDFENIKVKFSSTFFESKKEFSLEPKEEKTFKIKLEQEELKKLKAGFYTLIAEVQTKEKKARVEGTIHFDEKSDIVTDEQSSGWFVNTYKISRTNKGNTLNNFETRIEKNIVSRLFTSFSPQPDSSERDGSTVEYYWNQDIKPGETRDIIVRTNWFYPFFVIIFIVAIVFLAKRLSQTDLVLKKRVSFVRAKGGEFALKISITASAQKYIEKVRIIDKLPPLVKIHEKFINEKPIVNEKNKTLEWNFEKLEAGEIRRLSYIVYSKVGVLGKFALPSTVALYQKNGEIKESTSNRAFFIAEPNKDKFVD